MVYAAVIGRDIVCVEKDALLHCGQQLVVSMGWGDEGLGGYIRRLKLVTGVETSTRPARTSGRAGKRMKSRSLSAAAAAPRRSSVCCVSTGMTANCGIVCELVAKPWVASGCAA